MHGFSFFKEEWILLVQLALYYVLLAQTICRANCHLMITISMFHTIAKMVSTIYFSE
jgi:hypothetical protein